MTIVPVEKKKPLISLNEGEPETDEKGMQKDEKSPPALCEKAVTINEPSPTQNDDSVTEINNTEEMTMVEEVATQNEEITTVAEEVATQDNDSNIVQVTSPGNFGLLKPNDTINESDKSLKI